MKTPRRDLIDGLQNPSDVLSPLWPASGTNGTGVSPEEVKVVALNHLASWLNFRGILEYALNPLVAPVELAHRAAASVRTCSLMRECET